MEGTETASVPLLLDGAHDENDAAAHETLNTDENGTEFTGESGENEPMKVKPVDELSEHLNENEQDAAMVACPDGNIPEGMLAVNEDGFIVSCQDGVPEGLTEPQQEEMEMMDVDDPNADPAPTENPSETPVDQTNELLEMPGEFITDPNALIVQNEPPQQLMEEADTPGEVPAAEESNAAGDIDEGTVPPENANDESFFTYIEEKSDVHLQDSLEKENVPVEQEASAVNEEGVLESLAALQASEDVKQEEGDQEGVQGDENLQDSAVPSNELPADAVEDGAGEAMDLPAEDTGTDGTESAEGSEGFTLLPGGDNLDGPLSGLEGKLVVGDDGTVHLLTGQESLQGIQLMEGDEKSEEQANGEEAAAQMQQVIQAQLQEALMKQVEIKREQENKLESEPSPGEEPNPEADALATLASAALDHQAPSNGIKTEPDAPEVKPEQDSNEPQWMDVGICKGTHCVVRTFYIPGEGQSWDRNWENINTSTLPDHRALAKLELEAGKAYKFRVAAINSCGRGPWSEVSAFRTSMPGVPGAPSAIKISKTVEGAHLSWEPPSAASGTIEDYTVYMAVRSATTDSQTVSSGANQLAFVRIYQGAENQCSVGAETLTEAHIDTTTKPAILFRIAARNAKGLGPAIQVRWLQDGAAPNSAKPINAPRRVGPEIKPHASIKKRKSECE